MRIAKIEVFQVDLPCVDGVYTLSGRRRHTSFDATIVCITKECGIQDRGESTPFDSTCVQISTS